MLFFRKSPRVTRTLTLNSGHTLQVTLPTHNQYHRLAATVPARSWTRSATDRHAYERWLRSLLPFVSCTIDHTALAQRRLEMAALEVLLPADDVLAWVGYVCIDDPSDVQQMVSALNPQRR